jgi:hypothetical protein
VIRRHAAPTVTVVEPDWTAASASPARDAIGSDYALLVVVVGTKVPMGKQLGQNMLSAFRRGSGGGGGGVTFSAGVDFTQYSGTGIRVAMVDCKTGRVLWSDGDHEKSSLKDENLDMLAKDVLKRMP